MAKKPTRPKRKYGNAFLDALEDASVKEAEKVRKDSLADEVIVVVKDGMMALKKWRPKK